jgi:probable HAF family extracellular repeat protein
MTTYTFTTIDVPGSLQTVAEAINTSGQVAGYYDDSSGHEHGFLYSGGHYTTIDVHGNRTYANAINDPGQIVGDYVIYVGPVPTVHGFLATPVSAHSSDTIALTGGTVAQPQSHLSDVHFF